MLSFAIWRSRNHSFLSAVTLYEHCYSHFLFSSAGIAYVLRSKSWDSEQPLKLNYISITNLKYYHCLKSVHIRSFSGPYFPPFGLNTGKYGPEKLQIRTRFTQCTKVYAEYNFQKLVCPNYF